MAHFCFKFHDSNTAALAGLFLDIGFYASRKSPVSPLDTSLIMFVLFIKHKMKNNWKKDVHTVIAL